MHYDFANIKHINQVLEVIKDRDEFIVVDQGWFTTVRYAVVTGHTFNEVLDENEAIIHDLRGLIFDTNGDILSRPFHKFFNLNEKSFTQLPLIDFTKDHDTLIKLDGSMVRPVFSHRYNGFRLATKAGISDVAMQAEVFVAQNPHYFKIFRFCMENGLTPIFEYVAPDNRIVIQYEKADMILLAVRETISGKYFNMQETEELAVRFNVPCVTNTGRIMDIESYVESIRGRDDIEGVVARFSDGHMLKMKTDTYVSLHGLIDYTANDRRIFSLIADGAIDDIKAKADSFLNEKIEKAQEKYDQMFTLLVKQVDEKTSPHIGRDVKDLGLDKNLESLTKKMVFERKKGYDVSTIVADLIGKHLGRDIRFSEFVKEHGLEDIMEK